MSQPHRSHNQDHHGHASQKHAVQEGAYYFGPMATERPVQIGRAAGHSRGYKRKQHAPNCGEGMEKASEVTATEPV